MPSETEDLARFCAALPGLRRLLRGPASAARRAELEQAVRAVRRGEPVTEFLAGPDFADSDEDPGDYRSGLPPRVSGRSRPVTGVYLCPGDHCGRMETRNAGEAVPRCDIYERALTFVSEG